MALYFSAAALTIGSGAAITSSGAGGAMGTNAFLSTAFAPLASPSFTGTSAFPASGLTLQGSSTGVTTFASANAGASNFTLTFPALTANLITSGDTGTVTNAMLAGSIAASNIVTGTSGAAIPLLNGANTWSGVQTYTNSDIKLLGSSTGATTFTSANAGASNFVLNFPAATDTVVLLAATQTLTNKSISSGQITGLTSLATAVVGQIPGTTTNDSASAGNAGEFISSTIAVGSAVSMSTGAWANIASIALTAGDWDVVGHILLHPGATTVFSFGYGSITTVNNSGQGTPAASGITGNSLTAPATGGFTSNTNADLSIPISRTRISLSGNATYYLNAYASFTTSTLTGYGMISARRVR